MGLWGLVVLMLTKTMMITYSQETSTTTLKRLASPACSMNSLVINLGMGEER